MKRRELLDYPYETIKEHILDPNSSSLPPVLQYQLDRILSMTKVLDKNPVLKHAIALHRAKYPDISHVTAYKDARLSMKLYNSFMTFDYDFWIQWIINGIVSHINDCRKKNTVQHDKVIAMQYSNLIKAVGKRPDEIPDPKRNEKHNFFIMVNTGKQQIKIDPDKLEKLPVNTLAEINRALAAGNPITIEDAKTIMES